MIIVSCVYNEFMSVVLDFFKGMRWEDVELNIVILNSFFLVYVVLVDLC